jgi:MFS transporter, PPP family, 3-phenylpropionic acid transporter
MNRRSPLQLVNPASCTAGNNHSVSSGRLLKTVGNGCRGFLKDGGCRAVRAGVQWNPLRKATLNNPSSPSSTTALTGSKPDSRPFIVLWVLFFFQFAAIGMYFTFLNVYYKEVGLSGTQIGLISMISGVVSMAGSFLWGYLSDRIGKPSILIAGGTVGALLFTQLIPLVNLAGLANPLLWYILIGCLGALMTASSNTLVDSTCLAMLGERSRDYGRYRLWGSVGYIVAALFAGFLFDHVNLVWMFPAYGLLMLFFAIAALRLPQRAVKLQDSGWGQIGQMVRQPVWLVLMGTVFLFWVAYYASIMFMGVALKSMGANSSLISYAVVIGAIVEIPCMILSGRLIQRFGAVRLLWLALALQVIRFFLLSHMTDPVWAVAINLINGPGFVFAWNSFLNLISRLAPPSLLATAQGFFVAVTGLAGIAGSFISGMLLDQLGPSGLFLALSIICVASFILFGIGMVFRPALDEPAQPSPAS